MVLPRHKVDEDILADRVECPADFSPAHVDLICSPLAECVLPEEKHIAGSVFVHGPAVLLDETRALDNVN